MNRANNSGNRLTENDAAIVKGMLIRGDRQHDIAAWFGVNGGRIGEISKGRKFLHVQPNLHELPRPGPYLSGKVSESLIAEFRMLRSKARRILEINDLNPQVQSITRSMMDQLEAVIDDQG